MTRSEYRTIHEKLYKMELKLSANDETKNKKPTIYSVGLGETLRRLIRKRCRHSALEKFEDAFDTALDLTQTKPSDEASSTFFFAITSDRK